MGLGPTFNTNVILFEQIHLENSLMNISRFQEKLGPVYMYIVCSVYSENIASWSCLYFQVVKVGYASENARAQAEESGAQNGATQSLLQDYSVTPGSSVLRTPRTPALASDILMQVRKLEFVLYYNWLKSWPMSVSLLFHHVPPHCHCCSLIPWLFRLLFMLR